MKKTELLEIEPIQDLVELALWTLYLRNCRIVSLIIVAEPESGKTELLKKYRRNNCVHARKRFSAYGIQEDLIHGRINLLFEKPKILGSLVVYDLAALFSFKADTVDSTMVFIDGLTEDGLETESTYAMKSDSIRKFAGVKGGLMAAINTQQFYTPKGKRRIRANLMKGGFFSRIIVVSYAIPESLLREVFDRIVERARSCHTDKEFVKLITLDVPRKRKNVDLSEPLARELEKIVYDVKDELRDYLGSTVKGIRLFKSLISLAKASALRDGRNEVNSDDVARIRYLSSWMNLRMNPLKTNYPHPW